MRTSKLPTGTRRESRSSAAQALSTVSFLQRRTTTTSRKQANDVRWSVVLLCSLCSVPLVATSASMDPEHAPLAPLAPWLGLICHSVTPSVSQSFLPTTEQQRFLLSASLVSRIGSFDWHASVLQRSTLLSAPPTSRRSRVNSVQCERRHRSSMWHHGSWSSLQAAAAGRKANEPMANSRALRLSSPRLRIQSLHLTPRPERGEDSRTREAI